MKNISRKIIKSGIIISRITFKFQSYRVVFEYRSGIELGTWNLGFRALMNGSKNSYLFHFRFHRKWHQLPFSKKKNLFPNIRIFNEFQNELRYQFFLNLKNLGKNMRKMKILDLRWCCLGVNISSGFHPIIIIFRFPIIYNQEIVRELDRVFEFNSQS